MVSKEVNQIKEETIFLVTMGVNLCVHTHSTSFYGRGLILNSNKSWGF